MTAFLHQIPFAPIDAVLVVPGIAALLLALIPQYKLGSRVNMLASGLTFLCALTLLIERPDPAVSFLFGFDASDAAAAAAYRDWYENRYHAPQDDMSTPINFQAQADFHKFFFALTESVADADAKPVLSEGSQHRPGAK